MRNFFVLSVLFGLFVTFSLHAEVKRTDGPIGSEYGDPETLPGELQIGFHFGALLNSGSSDDSSFSLGADIDWRPYDLFGFRASVYQALQEPRSTLISLTPVAHTEFSNLRPYAIFGPGIGIVQNEKKDHKLKFIVAAGVGADVLLTERFGIGMEYIYHSVMDFDDLHLLGARLLISF